MRAMSQPSLAGRRILLGVSGGIAAYKSAEFVRLLRKAGAEVQVVLSDGGARFITPVTLQALSGHPVRQSLWDENAEAAMGHIELARWPDLIVVAPASANAMARLAAGMTTDLLSTVCLASDRPLMLAPAMNRLMWAHPATQENAQRLRARGVQLVGVGRRHGRTATTGRRRSGPWCSRSTSEAAPSTSACWLWRVACSRCWRLPATRAWVGRTLTGRWRCTR